MGHKVQVESAKLIPPTPKKLRLPRPERERQILGVALEMFILKGYQGTTMEDIAEAAEVTRPVVYNLFGAKDAVYLACLRLARGCLDQRLIESAGAHVDGTGRERLRAGIEGYFQFVEQDRAAWRLLFGGGAAIAGSAVGEARRMRFETVDRIAALLAPLMPHIAEPFVVMHAHALSGAAEQLAKWWVENEQVERSVVVDLLMDLMWRGFEARFAT
jgi:AcrR family transcriptional regulator